MAPRSARAKSASLRLTLALLLIGVAGGGCVAGGGGAGGGGLGAALGVTSRITFDVSGFGAVGDGQSDDTLPVQHALEAARQAGGATVLLPRGTYLVRPLRLFSGLTLRLTPDATLLLTDDPAAYPTVDADGQPLPRRGGLSAINARDITITGGGVIDGQGARFWATATTGDDGSEIDRRPATLLFASCVNVRVDGVTLRNAPRAGVTVLNSDGVTIRSTRFEAPSGAPESHGIVVDSSRDVLVDRCLAEIGAGDAVALRATGGRATEAVTVRETAFRRARGGVAVGPGVAAGVRGVRVTDCTFADVDAAIRVRPSRDAGGVIEGIAASNLTMDGVGSPFEIGFAPSEPAPSDATATAGDDAPAGLASGSTNAPPRVADLRFSNLVVRRAKRAGIISGDERAPITRLDFRQVQIAAQYGITCSWAADVSFREAVIATDFGPAMIRSNTTDLRLDRWQETTPEPTESPATMPATRAPTGESAG